ncbi:hypothetical protein HW932_17080 [Allochromatium humboldtianum]|uniref:Uncharacterized protein n=2 Tax=Allochromatium humboldtianum TaxID=504901 RepID=A0A850RQ03_9GAMM|nr:hypothetical protein [Allochromatium humboldtianum]
MPVYNVYWKAIKPNGSSHTGGKTVIAHNPWMAENQVKAEVQQRWPDANVFVTDIKER